MRPTPGAGLTFANCCVVGEKGRKRFSAVVQPEKAAAGKQVPLFLPHAERGDAPWCLLRFQPRQRVFFSGRDTSLLALVSSAESSTSSAKSMEDVEEQDEMAGGAGGASSRG